MLIGAAMAMIAAVVIASLLREKKQIIIKNETSDQHKPAATVAFEKVAYSTTNKNNFKEWELRARSANYFQNEKRVALQDVTVNLYRPDGTMYQIHGEYGEYNTETKNIMMRGNVRASMPDNTTMQTESFFYDNTQRTIRTDAPIVIQRSGLRLEGVGMVVDLTTEKLSLLGNVKATGSK